MGWPNRIPIRSAAMARAWIVRELGTPDKLRFEVVDAAAPSADALIRIRVHATAVNFFDLLQIAGTYQVKPDLPFSPAAELTLEIAYSPWFPRMASTAVATPKPPTLTRTRWSRSRTRCRSSRPLPS